MFDLSGQKALVTGASGGIGGAIARALHAQGASVMLAGTREPALSALAAELGERAHTLVADLSQPDEPERLVRETEAVLGQLDIIATASGLPYRHNFTGNVTELCPVGALTSKTYRFKSLPWDLNRTQTTCTQCAVGCQQFADVRYGKLLRTMLVEDDPISDGWLCDRGRYNVGFYESPDRLRQPLYRKHGTTGDGPMTVLGKVEQIWRAGDTSDFNHRELLVCVESARKFVERQQQGEQQALDAASPMLQRLQWRRLYGG